ncbi:hypothetical protein HMPREF1078_00150 [Parabacteroides merdae CL09T00C40]|uniref:Uncharacterized protein n=1 Tax=Parabacteroides merdae TaxID=46503 RepID=A0A6N3C8S5_9BACT|nr:hypothetical protein PARMER_00375 [Parabacteroides merdae ATCC 43184]EKN35683.1 hypothetical protein HMPREF1078_00150 [Parabacteroides merdae CL09T00C40]CUP69566.1 Uncharacterised protein [Parabacteroides merdae]SUV35981.1 Uncharacterised protein [Parabacteroides merdae]
MCILDKYRFAICITVKLYICCVKKYYPQYYSKNMG